MHPRDDARIFVKMVRTLALHEGWSVLLVVADGNGSSVVQGAVSVIDIGKLPANRLRRATLGIWRALREIRRLKVDLVHFHDPELIPVGMALKMLGHRVIYDVHEDVPRQILSKYWLPPLLRRPAALAMSVLEWVGARIFDAIVPATPKIAQRSPSNKTVMVQNFPILAELIAADPVPYLQRSETFAYIGGISELRGARQMVQALGNLARSKSASLDLAGNILPLDLETELKSLPGWAAVKFHGRLPRAGVAQLLGGVRAGLVLLHPTENYSEAYPVKMFEYMAAGLPVIASDFPLWRSIVDAAGCGLLVNPLDVDAITAAMRWILDHPEQAEEMGRKGRRAVEQVYNWERESVKLLALYERLLTGTAVTA